MNDRPLNITEQSKKTCRLLNILCTGGTDKRAAIEIEQLILDCAFIDCPINVRYATGTDCDDDEYDDFLTSPKYLYERSDFYPLTNAIYRHAHPSIIAVLYKYCKNLPNYHLICKSIKNELIHGFSQLYRNEFYIKRAANPNTFHYKLKQLAASYLEILELTPDIFNLADEHKIVDPAVHYLVRKQYF